jgi:hypothetical protein
MRQGITACVRCGRCFDPGLCPECSGTRFLPKARDLPKVHDLRVNPGDLPDNNLRDVLVFSKTRHGCKCHTGYYQPHFGEWKRVENGDSVTIPNVIGWQELPTWEGMP